MAEIDLDRREMAELYTNEPQPMEDEDNPIDFIALLRTLWREKRMIAIISFGIFALATVIAFFLTPQFTSTATFIPPALNNGSSMASAVAGQLSAIGAGDLLGGGKTSGDLDAGILRSRSIASELVKQFNLMERYKVKKESKAEELLGAGTNVTVDTKSTIVTVSVTDKSPELAQALANAYMDALRKTDGRLALGQSSQRRLFFGQQLAKEKDDLEDAEVELKKTEEKSGLIAPAGQTESEIRTIAETRAQMAIRQVQLAALRQSATEQNPDVIRLQSEISDLQGQLQRLQNGNEKGIAAIPTSKVPELQLEYIRKEREVKYHEALFEMLSKQYEVAHLDEAHDAPILQVLDSASYPDTKSSPKRMYIMAGGLLMGLFAGCFWVLTRDRIHEARAALLAVRPPNAM
jgi:tyrosine-protein kinase Etk/Wzc